MGLPLGQFMLRFSPKEVGVEAEATPDAAPAIKPAKINCFKCASNSFLER